MNNSNSSRRPVNFRTMKKLDTKMELNEFVGIEKPCVDDIEDMPIAMAYVPWQQWRKIYEPKDALKRGTIFKELDLPFEAAKECK